ncbi:MAG: Digeranylgeranylglycerophospholipid reductase [Methanocella sp. PtaU1.Bin125]|nr:MAG: Digeranylgeranylglycerophospholipid reductase [Methanocella sp. PtaU1.Bin125]
MKDRYDVIVAGAGPAGSVAAKTAAMNGLSVLLLEKRQEIGEPVRCAEGILCDRLTEFTPPDPRWICGRVRRLRIHTKDVTLSFNDERDVIYITDRKIFDRELARSAAAAGADVVTKTQVTGLIVNGGQVCGVKGKCRSDEFTAAAQVVVAADGIESRIARWAGIDTTLGLKDIVSCAQYHLTDIDIDPGQIELYFGSDLAPGGYAWVFPKGEREANVGLGVVYHGRKSRSSAEHLDDFVRARFPGANAISIVAGAVPISGLIPVISGNGIVAVGDAARLSDPLTGEGILNGMISGRIAGNVIADCIRKSDVTAAALRQYDIEMAKVLGPALERNYALKEHLRNAGDRQFSLLFRTARALGAEKYPTSAVINEVFYPKSRRAATLMHLIVR